MQGDEGQEVPRQKGYTMQTTVDPNRRAMLLALNYTKPDGAIYQGTVPAHVVAKRRAKNKAARKARRIGRR